MQITANSATASTMTMMPVVMAWVGESFMSGPFSGRGRSGCRSAHEIESGGDGAHAGHGDLRPGAARRALHRGDAVLDGEDLQEAAVHALVAVAPDLPRLDEDALAGGVQPALGLLEVGASSDLGLQITNVGRRGGREQRRTGA